MGDYDLSSGEGRIKSILVPSVPGMWLFPFDFAVERASYAVATRCPVLTSAMLVPAARNATALEGLGAGLRW
eukprot:191796-Rhodomonas_salina.2